MALKLVNILIHRLWQNCFTQCMTWKERRAKKYILKFPNTLGESSNAVYNIHSLSPSPELCCKSKIRKARDHEMLISKCVTYKGNVNLHFRDKQNNRNNDQEKLVLKTR